MHNIQLNKNVDMRNWFKSIIKIIVYFICSLCSFKATAKMFMLKKQLLKQ